MQATINAGGALSIDTASRRRFDPAQFLNLQIERIRLMGQQVKQMTKTPPPNDKSDKSFQLKKEEDTSYKII